MHQGGLITGQMSLINSLIAPESSAVCIASQAGDRFPANVAHSPGSGPLLGHRLRRWPNSEPEPGCGLEFDDLLLFRSMNGLDSVFVSTFHSHLGHQGVS